VCPEPVSCFNNEMDDSRPTGVPTPSAWCKGRPTRIRAGQKQPLLLAWRPRWCLTDAAGHSWPPASPGGQPHHHHRAEVLLNSPRARPQTLGPQGRATSRIHSSSGPISSATSRAFSPDRLAVLQNLGTSLQPSRAWALPISLRPCRRRQPGVADPRRSGGPGHRANEPTPADCG